MTPPKISDPTPSSEGNTQRNILDSEIREMAFELTRRLSDLQNQPHKNIHHPLGSKTFNHHHRNHNSVTDDDDDDDDSGVRVITLAGSNTGAIMRGELTSNKSSSPLSPNNMDPTSGSYVNSNSQAINNSIMMGGSYSSNDPGVHMDITDYEPEQHHLVDPAKKHGGKAKGKKKKEGVSKSDHHSDPNSD